jgi:hypothetical protein
MLVLITIIILVIFYYYMFYRQRPRHTHKATKSCSRRLQRFERLYRNYPLFTTNKEGNKPFGTEKTRDHKIYTFKNIKRLYNTCKESKAFNRRLHHYHELFSKINIPNFNL